MRIMSDLSQLTEKEKAVFEFIRDEYKSLDRSVASEHCDDFVQHYRDEAGFIMANVENILKNKNSTTESVITPKQMEELIKFLSKEYIHSTDTVDPRTTEDSTYIEGINNEARFFASRICCILGLDSSILKEG